MTQDRPPLPARWEYHLLTTVLNLALIALQLRPRGQASTNSVEDPTLRAWLDRRDDQSVPHRSRTQLQREREVLRLLMGAWLTWRAYQLEQRELSRPPT